MNVATAALGDVFEFPCSFAQQRLWLDCSLAMASPFYNIHASLRLTTPLEPDPLQRALSALISRHETLRTTLIERDGIPYQRVSRVGACDFRTEDLRAMPVEAREQHIRELARSQATQVFDLEQGPLLRVRLLRTGSVDCVLMLTIHHIVADAWSMRILFRDISALYTAAAGGASQALPELSIQYGDYCVWQRQATQSTLHDAALAYWRERLAGLPVLELPTDYRRPAVASHRGFTLPLRFDAALSSRVLSFARDQAVTPYVVLLAALAIVFQRNAGQNTVVVGAPVAGRDRPELENLIGFFVNTLVLRLELGGNPTFTAFVQLVRDTLHGALAHQALPFDRLVEELQPSRDLSRNPLFQVSVQYLAAAQADNARQSNQVAVLEVQRGAANFDVSVDFVQSGGQLEGRVEYATDLFSQSTVQRWIAQLERVLTQVLANPGLSIDSVDLLSAAERHQLTHGWAGDSAPYPRDSTLARQFAAQVCRAPDAPALRAPGMQWTYAELDRCADDYAQQLARLGVGRNARIGVSLARGPQQIAAVLGIVRRAATYVALDASWPRTRLEHCIRAANIEHVICEPMHEQFAALGVAVLNPDDVSTVHMDVVSTLDGDPLDTAYVAFTSGSTGAPKAVVVPHRAVLRLVCGNPQIPLRPDDTMLAYAPLAFDASTFEVWGALCNGASLSLPSPGQLGLDELAHWIESERITVAWLTAGLFHQLAATHPAALARIERVYAGGDVLSSHAVRGVLQMGRGKTQVLNGYGPTENTTFTCVHAMVDAADVSDPVPIGRPIANGYVRVVDEHDRIVPIGVAGELLTGGDGVALGYLDDPGSTAQSFPVDPIDPRRGRVYRTGDRARWRADGSLEFLGRIDRQFKVHGYRIEPAEIESALRSLPGVSDAYVLARADGSGDKRLIAHVATAAPVTSAELLRQLATQLPQWMLPTQLHAHSELRLGATGKIDYAALRDYSPAAAEPEPLQTPDGEIESLVASVWTEVLGHPVTNANANFFAELGGHSLLATQAVSRLNVALEIKLPLAAIFEEPTLRRFSARVEEVLLADIQSEPR